MCDIPDGWVEFELDPEKGLEWPEDADCFVYMDSARLTSGSDKDYVIVQRADLSRVMAVDPTVVADRVPYKRAVELRVVAIGQFFGDDEMHEREMWRGQWEITGIEVPLKEQYMGMGKHRLQSCPTEAAMTLAWQAENDQPGRSAKTLEYLLDPDNKGRIDLSDRDWVVAGTVIQWLGTPVGQSFLHEVLLGPAWKHWRNEFCRTSMFQDIRELPPKGQKAAVAQLQEMVNALEIMQNRQQGPLLYKEEKFCNFCLKPRSEVAHLVQGVDTGGDGPPLICDVCIQQALKVLEEHRDSGS
jgi:hypothetical protein